MLAEFLRARNQRQQLFFIHVPVQKADFAHLRLSLGQRPRFIHGERVKRCRRFHGFAGFDQHPALRGVPDRRHHSRRRSQNQRAGAEHDERRHRAGHVPGHQQNQRRTTQRDGHQDPCPAVREPNDRRFLLLRFPDQAHHLLQRGIVPGPNGFHLHRSLLVHGSLIHLVSHAFRHRDGFPGHHRLADQRGSAPDCSIRRNRLPRAHEQDIPGFYVVRRDDLLPLRRAHTGRLRGQADQRLKAFVGFRGRLILQHLAELHDERNLPRGEILPQQQGRRQRDGHQNVGRHVELRHQPAHRAEHDRRPAEQHGDPRRGKRQPGKPAKKIRRQKSPGKSGQAERPERFIRLQSIHGKAPPLYAICPHMAY